MGQLNPGIFLNITDADLKKFEDRIDFNGEASEDIKLMMTWIDAGYNRVQFDVEGKSIIK